MRICTAGTTKAAPPLSAPVYRRPKVNGLTGLERMEGNAPESTAVAAEAASVTRITPRKNVIKVPAREVPTSVTPVPPAVPRVAKTEKVIREDSGYYADDRASSATPVQFVTKRQSSREEHLTPKQSQSQQSQYQSQSQSQPHSQLYSQAQSQSHSQYSFEDESGEIPEMLDLGQLEQCHICERKFVAERLVL